MKFLYVLLYLLFFIGLTLYRKCDRKISIVRYLIIQIIFTMIINAMLATTLFIFGLSLMPMFVASAMGVIGLVLIILAFKRKKIQQYSFEWMDCVSTLAIVACSLLVGFSLFGTDLHLAYNNADPAAHFFMTQNNLVNQEHSGMYFYEVNNSLLINGLSLFVKNPFSNYKLYLIIEIGMLALGGLMLYVLTSEFSKKNWQYGICAILAVLYMLGYCLNNMIFGFGYLGASVTLICFIMFVCKKFWDKAIDIKIFVPLMAMCVLSLALCYMLFAPVIWIIVAAIMWRYCCKNRIRAKKLILLEMAIFLIPLVLVVRFCYYDFFLSTNLNVGDQLRAMGGAYENYITNFLVFIPIALYAIIRNVKNKTNFITTLFVLGWIVFVILAVVLKQIGVMSPYYCLKTYYVLWMMAFVILADGIMQLTVKFVKFVWAYLLAVVVMVTTAFFVNGNPLVDVYEYNFRWLKLHDVVGNETIRAFQYAKWEIMDNDEKIIWLTDLSQYGRVFWFYSMQAINTNNCEYCQTWNHDSKELKEIIKEYDVNYAGIFKYAPYSYQPYEEIIKDKKIVFETLDIAIYEL